MQTSENQNRSERQNQLRRMLEQVAPDRQIGRLAEELQAGGGSQEGPTLDVLLAGNDDENFALETLDALVREGPDFPLDAEQQDSLEAIVLPRYRPVLDIIDDSFEAPPRPWEHLGTGDIRRRIEAVIPSIGRIEVPGHPQLPYAGTGFVVGAGLLMTNRHVAEIFANGLGDRGLMFRPGQTAGIDFRRERIPSEPEVLTVQDIVMIHPYWDMALLRVTGLPSRHASLRMSVADPADLQQRDIVVIGYPAQDMRNDQNLQNRIFRNAFNIKRLQPGKLLVRTDVGGFGRNVNAVTHDSSTLGGNSGSAVIDVTTGDVVGLHFAGKYLVANYAVPAFDLAQDSRVVDAGVNFAGRLGHRGDFYGPIWAESGG
jgi:endonuclease G, mitochondrial